MRGARFGMTLFKTLLFTILVPGTFLVYLPWTIGSSGDGPIPLRLGILGPLGLIPLALGALTYLRCAWDFVATGRGTPAPVDPPKELVARGLYRYVRNPMYVGGLLMVFGWFLWLGSAWLLLYGGALFLMFHCFVVFYEEPTLERTFGDSYARYCRAVSRWMPRIPR